MSTRTFTFQVQAAPPPPTNSPLWLTTAISSGVGLNQWFQIPGTAPSTCPQGETLVEGTRRNGFLSWSGAALRRANSTYIMAALGGHANYTGNEVRAIVLQTDVPQWFELRSSSIAKVGAPGSVLVGNAAVYYDGRKSSTHTYWQQQFHHADDRLVMMPCDGPLGYVDDPAWRAAYNSTQIVCSFSAASWTSNHPSNDWDAAQMLAEQRGFYPRNTGSSGWVANMSCANPVTNDMYQAANDGELYKLDGVTRTWSKVAQLKWMDYAGSAVDPTRNLLFATGGYSSFAWQRPIIVDLAAGAERTVTWTGLGANVLAVDRYPAVIFDEENDRFLVFINDNPITCFSVTRVNDTTWDVAQVMTVNPPPSRTNGLSNSIQYVPALKCVVMAHTWESDMYAMRLG